MINIDLGVGAVRHHPRRDNLFLCQDPVADLLKLGSARVILATATSGVAMSAVQGGVAVNGTLLIVGVAESMQVSPLSLLMGCRSVKGWYSGTSINSRDKLAFSVRTGVRSMNETYLYSMA